MDWSILLEQLREKNCPDQSFARDLIAAYATVDATLRETLLLCAHYGAEHRCADDTILDGWITEVTKDYASEPEVELRKRLVWNRLLYLNRQGNDSEMKSMLYALGEQETEAAVWKKVLSVLGSWEVIGLYYHLDLYAWPRLQELREQLPELSVLEKRFRGRHQNNAFQAAILVEDVLRRWSLIVDPTYEVSRVSWIFGGFGQANAPFPVSHAFFRDKLASKNRGDAELMLAFWGQYLGEREVTDDPWKFTVDFWQTIAGSDWSGDIATFLGFWKTTAKVHLALVEKDPGQAWKLWESGFRDLLDGHPSALSDLVADDLHRVVGNFLTSLIPGEDLAIDWDVWSALTARPEFGLRAMAVNVIRLAQVCGHDVQRCRRGLERIVSTYTDSDSVGESKDVEIPQEILRAPIPKSASFGLWAPAVPEKNDPFFNFGGLYRLLQAVIVPETTYRAARVLKALDA